MIRIFRGMEPPSLAQVRTVELTKLRDLEKERPITGDDVDGYRVVARELWEMQYAKCCYCEMKVTAIYNDVEHFRPKGRADRGPGCTQDHGYFWLSFTWENLLFACPLCNRTGKNDRFPLKNGSRPLLAWEMPPGKERLLLLDPAVEQGVEHIEFVPRTRSPRPGHESTWQDVDRWTATPRGASERGKYSIEVFGMNHEQLQDLYLNHVRDTVRPCYEGIRRAIDAPDRSARKERRVQEEVRRAKDTLFTRSVPFVGLSYDALRFFVPSSRITPFGATWPGPRGVGTRPPQRSHHPMHPNRRALP